MGLKVEFDALKREIARATEDLARLEATTAWVVPDETAHVMLHTRVTLDADSDTVVSLEPVPHEAVALHFETLRSAQEFNRSRAEGLLRVMKAAAL